MPVRARSSRSRFSPAGKRRDWPPTVKASIVAESYSGAETACAVARRHGLASSQLFTWRRELRKKLADRGLAVPKAPPRDFSFVPAVIDPTHQIPGPNTCARRPFARVGKARGVFVIGRRGDCHFTADRLILRLPDQNRCAQVRSPSDMIRHGWSVRRFQAKQQ